MKRLFFDIETSPLVVLSWRTGYKINIAHENIISERKIICASWKWEGENKIHSIWWDKDQDDKNLIEAIVPVLNEADEVVGHWLDGFDLPWVKTRALVNGIQTHPSYKTIDTCKWARSHFYFNSNKLDYIANLLGVGRKIRSEDGLWRRVVLQKDPKALAFMVKYNKHDIALLEGVYQHLQKVVPHKTHVGVLMGNDKWTCPKEGTAHVHTDKKRVTKLGTVQWQMQCNDCGYYYAVSDKAHEEYKSEKKRKQNLKK